MVGRLIKKFKAEFGFRINVTVVGLIFLMTVSFAAFLICQQCSFIVEKMINNGTVLSRLLAYSSRIGVFSENPDLLKDPIQGIFQQKGVLNVCVYNVDGKLLAQQNNFRGNMNNEILPNGEDLFVKRRPLLVLFNQDAGSKYVDQIDYIEFWAAVTSQKNKHAQEALFFSLDTKPSSVIDRITGYVMIAIDRRLLNKQIQTLLIRGIFVAILFMIVGSLLSFAITRRIIQPLNRLTWHVNRLRLDEPVGPIPIETIDEIGKLAQALNEMSASLKNRENALLTSRQRLRLLSSQLLQAQEDERRRLSRELHDGLGQTLAMLKHQIRDIEKQASPQIPEIGGPCRATTAFVTEIINDLRRISKDLSPSILEDIGLEAAVKWLIKNFREQHHVAVTEEIDTDANNRLSKDAQTNLYRLFQEALSNIGKYAQATQIHFKLRFDGTFVDVLIADNGIGFDLQKALDTDRSQRGLGLTTMEERARMLGATFEIESHIGKGTSILLRIPADLS